MSLHQKGWMWSITAALNFYKDEKYRECKQCILCPARFWKDYSTGFCGIILRETVDEIPMCTEYDWSKFMMEYL